MLNSTAASVAVGAISRFRMAAAADETLPSSIWRVSSLDDQLLKMDMVLFAVFFTLFGLFDFVIAQRTKARWWLLHLFANALVCIVGARDCYRTLIDPANCTYSLDYSVAPTYIIAGIHAYHIMSFSNLTSEDVWHHLMFVPAICGIALLIQAGPLLSVVGLFMSGMSSHLAWDQLEAIAVRMAESSVLMSSVGVVSLYGILARSCCYWHRRESAVAATHDIVMECYRIRIVNLPVARKYLVSNAPAPHRPQ